MTDSKPQLPPTEDQGLLKIGEVAERVGLSLRTIRFYEEEGLVVPEGRTSGGFRLCSLIAVKRLELIKRMKPLGFTVEEMVDVLSTLDDFETTASPGEHARTSLDGSTCTANGSRPRQPT